jgi:hypothetical protein
MSNHDILLVWCETFGKSLNHLIKTKKLFNYDENFKRSFWFLFYQHLKIFLSKHFPKHQNFHSKHCWFKHDTVISKNNLLMMIFNQVVIKLWSSCNQVLIKMMFLCCQNLIQKRRNICSKLLDFQNAYPNKIK